MDWGGLDPQGGELQNHRADQNHLTDQLGRKDIFQHLVPVAIKVAPNG